MNAILEQFKPKFEECLKHFESELSSLRGGRATPALVENIIVEAYGAKQPLKALASILVPDPKTIIVQPWDKSIMRIIESAIRGGDTGVSPAVDGAVIRISLPPLTEESRKEIVKIVHQKMEQTRIAVRNVREEAREGIIKAEDKKEITEDERFVFQEKIDEMVKDLNERIKKHGENKEREIMQL